MSRALRFHLDENCPNSIAQGLQRVGVDVTTTKDVGLGGAIDEEHLAFAASEGRVLVTRDQDLVILHDSGIPHKGIIYSRMGYQSVGEIISDLLVFWELAEPDDLIGKLIRL